MGDEGAADLARFRGSLLGLAPGDALGMPLEGMRASDISGRLGRVCDFMDAPWRMLKAGQWTGNTMMALAQARSIVRRGGFDLDDTAREFMAWFEANQWRGIGKSAYESMRRLIAGTSPRESGMRGEMAAGNGSIMRTAPLGLLHFRDETRLRDDVRAAAAVTHDNGEAIAGSAALAFAVARAARGDLVPASLIPEATAFIGACAVSQRLELAAQFLERDMEVEEALARLGTGGSAAETVASAFLCFLRTPHDFRESVSRAAGGGLDADTTAAVAGALSGAYNGMDAIPARWLEELEGREEILELAEGLHRIASAPSEGAQGGAE